MQLLIGDAAHRERQLLERRRFAHARDHDLFEAQRVRSQLEVLLLRSRSQGDGARHGPMPDVARREHHLLAACPRPTDGDRVGPVGPRHGAEVAVGHHHVGTAQRLASLRRDSAGDDRSILRQQRTGCEDREYRGETEL